jgi:hypothetical protein
MLNGMQTEILNQLLYYRELNNLRSMICQCDALDNHDQISIAKIKCFRRIISAEKKRFMEKYSLGKLDIEI